MKDADKTITQIFWDRVAQNREKPLFLYHKAGDFPPFTHKGKLRKMSWREVGQRVKNVGMGLMALGVKRGDRISIMANTSPEWVIADLALLSIGGETGSIYPNNLAAQAQYIINDLESRFVFLEGSERRDGLLGLKANSPQLKKIITIGCEAGDDPLCMSFEDLMALGADNQVKFSQAFDDAVVQAKLGDIASYIYTSGTTGIPKGAVHNHASITYTVCTGAAWMPIEPGYVDLSFLPMAHIFEQFAGPFLDIYRGDVITAFARELDTVAQDFTFAKPHYTRCPPRLLEKVYSIAWSKTDVLSDLSPAGFKEALDTAGRVRVAGALEGKEILDTDVRKLENYEENHFQHLKELVFGGNLKFFVAGGAPLSREINAFFWKLGLPVYELYGMTETGGATTNLPGAVKLGTVGRNWPGDAWPTGGGKTKLSPEGEILMRGPNVMLGYHGKADETAEAVRDGWMHSGDIGQRDEDGYLRITDRIKDILITAGGKNVAPVGIEGMLKEDPLISQVVVYGDRRKYLTALVTLDEEEIFERAKDLKIEGSYEELTSDPLMIAEVKKIIEQKNANLARFETIKDFILLDHDLSIENGDLTPTMKVKRKDVFKKYGHLMEDLYSD